jgi:hypothetical protein
MKMFDDLKCIMIVLACDGGDLVEVPKQMLLFYDL